MLPSWSFNSVTFYPSFPLWTQFSAYATMHSETSILTQKQ